MITRRQRQDLALCAASFCPDSLTITNPEEIQPVTLMGRCCPDRGGLHAISFLTLIVVFFSAISLPMRSQDQATKAPGHYMFAWTGDLMRKGNDFLAVIDADPASPSYGRLMTSVETDQPTREVHHTEYVMPASGMLFGNDHDAGRTFIFDVRDALHPKIAASFTDMAGYMHPHSFLRLPQWARARHLSARAPRPCGGSNGRQRRLGRD